MEKRAAIYGSPLNSFRRPELHLLFSLGGSVELALPVLVVLPLVVGRCTCIWPMSLPKLRLVAGRFKVEGRGRDENRFSPGVFGADVEGRSSEWSW